MRELMKPGTVLTGLAGGLAVACLCMPYLLCLTPPGALRLLRLAFLVPVSVLAFQVSSAWTPHAGKGPMLRPDLRTADWVRLLVLSLTLAAAAHLWIDPILAQVLPDYFPASLRDLLLSLPWMALFQPLLFVGATYAFAARLTRRQGVAVAAVMLAYQGVLLLQLHARPHTRLAVLLMLLTGVHALVLALSYRAWGFNGPVLIGICSQLRHLWRFF